MWLYLIGFCKILLHLLSLIYSIYQIIRYIHLKL
jgi:hypothetical protein